MGGGLKTVILIHTIFMDTFFPYLYCVARDICQNTNRKRYDAPTISISKDQINITVQIENDEFYMLERNNSILYTASPKSSNVETNKTHFTLLTSCASATGSYVLLAGTHHGSSCHYFNVTNCQSYSTSTHLAQSSCSECEYTISTITQFVIIIFYSIF
uniref:Glycoprotein E51 n=1 Tax=Elephant endotheliotropic herpesvirus 1A TaxID=759753 RepID=A0A8B6NPW5_ELHV1|nr:glycoprotein E51 [Elephant endotheliotropic herpesvirus 1A]